jgi:hypothetical protein
MPAAPLPVKLSITASPRFAPGGAAWRVVFSMKSAKAMQQFALYGVNFGCNLLDQKLRALAQQESHRVTSFVDRLSDARIHWIAGFRRQCACSVAPGIDG